LRKGNSKLEVIKHHIRLRVSLIEIDLDHRIVTEGKGIDPLVRTQETDAVITTIVIDYPGQGQIQGIEGTVEGTETIAGIDAIGEMIVETAEAAVEIAGIEIKGPGQGPVQEIEYDHQGINMTRGEKNHCL
jgi:hypothetical protein